MSTQSTLAFDKPINRIAKPFSSQLLKWVGNKQRFSAEIVSSFPAQIDRYFEPFLGSAAVLGTLAHPNSVGSDAFEPLIGIWQMLNKSPEQLKQWYKERWELIEAVGKREAYAATLASFNASPNPADFLFLCRSCYGGIVRFRKIDGGMSTPCGPHMPISPDSFSKRVEIWHRRVSKATFVHCDYRESMNSAKRGDVVYCDPPYTDSQKILYGAQAFNLSELMQEIEKCKRRGVKVILSIDGTKRSGEKLCDVDIPKKLFKSEISIDIGRSMLRRFQMNGQTLENEKVSDRLLLTY